MKIDFFYNGKVYEPGARSMERWPTWFTVNYGRRCSTVSLEHALGAMLVGGSSSAVGEIQEESLRILTEGFTGRCGGGVGPAAKDKVGGKTHSVHDD
jgi:hypothetical protein